MTRRALQVAVPGRLRPAIIAWFAALKNPTMGDVPVPQVLREAGYRRLKAGHHGVERDVLIGPRVVVKTQGWRDQSPAWTRYRRARTLAPTIQLRDAGEYNGIPLKGIIAQPRGRVLCRLGRRARTAKVDRRTSICEYYNENVYNIGDTHSGNLALFPDGTVRQIDY